MHESSMDEFPIHFFTIVLNGRPFIEYHLQVFKQLPFSWHWHIIEGAANLVHDTAWGRHRGGQVADSIHRDGRSVDGTSAYLDGIAAGAPGRITIYRQPLGDIWDGKIAMIRAPLPALPADCLLWQVDADELWTTRQITTMRDLFLEAPQRTAAYFLCHYFVGEDRLCTSIDTYGNNRSYEWLRVWRYRHGDQWLSHEPPCLARPIGDGTGVDVAMISPFLHEETATAGLVFQHFAYACPEQAAFKELYYGYIGAVDQWKRLQTQSQLPCRLADYFPWVKDETIVDFVSRLDVRPLARRNRDDSWSFELAPTWPGIAPAVSLLKAASPLRRRLLSSLGNEAAGLPLDNIRHAAIFRLDNIGDVVQSTGFMRELRRILPSASITIFVGSSAAELLQYCPYVNRVISVPQVISAAPDHPQVDAIRNEIAQHFCGAFELALNPRFAEDYYCANLYMQATGAPLRIGFQQKILANGYDATSYLSHAIVAEHENVAPLMSTTFLQVLSGKPAEPRLELWSSHEQEAAAAATIAEVPNRIGPFCAIGIGASQAFRVWPVDCFAELCLRLTRRGMTPVLFGSSQDMPAAEQIQAASGNACINVTGRLALGAAVALMRRCELFIGNDSGPKHVAAATGVPVVEVGWVPKGSPHGGVRGSLTRMGTFGAPTVIVNPENAFSDRDILSGVAIESVSVDRVEAAALRFLSSHFLLVSQ